MIEKNKRLNKAIGLATAVHLGAAAILGAYFWSPLMNKDNKIIELTLAGAPPKKAASKPVQKPKVRIKPKKDDIVDKRLKAPDPVKEEVKEDVVDEDPGEGTSTGSGTGNSGEGQGQTGQAVQLPYVTYSTTPPYPQDARKNGIEGTTRIRVLIDESGRVTEASVSGSSGSSSLDQSALQAIYKWRFSPARDANGNKVKCYVNIPVVFRLRK